MDTPTFNSTPSTTLNGIEPAALAAAVTAVAENPALGAIAFRARTRWQGQHSCPSISGLDSLQIESSAALDLRGAFGIDPAVPPGTDRIRYVVRVKGDATREQLEEIHREVMAQSPNRWHLAVAIPLEAELHCE